MSELPAVGGSALRTAAEQAGKDYRWCACGGSSRQPFCDGSHAGTPFSPLKWTAPDTGPAAFRACKRTTTPPLCDG